eukprot:363544-Chlamydomonas_euryale.AAC.9
MRLSGMRVPRVDVMYISEAVHALADTLCGTVAAGGQVLLAHGRNRGGEAEFFDTVCVWCGALLHGMACVGPRNVPPTTPPPQ